MDSCYIYCSCMIYKTSIFTAVQVFILLQLFNVTFTYCCVVGNILVIALQILLQNEFLDFSNRTVDCLFNSKCCDELSRLALYISPRLPIILFLTAPLYIPYVGKFWQIWRTVGNLPKFFPPIFINARVFNKLPTDLPTHQRL